MRVFFYNLRKSFANYIENSIVQLPDTTLIDTLENRLLDTAQTAKGDTATAPQSVRDASEILFDKFQSWYETAVNLLPNFLVALIVIVVFYLFSRMVRILLLKLLQRIMSNEAVMRIMLNISTFTVMLIGLIIALNVLQLQHNLTARRVLWG